MRLVTYEDEDEDFDLLKGEDAACDLDSIADDLESAPLEGKITENDDPTVTVKSLSDIWRNMIIRNL